MFVNYLLIKIKNEYVSNGKVPPCRFKTSGELNQKFNTSMFTSA